MKKKIILKLTEEQVEDLRSCISISQQQFKKGLHKDSPNFRKAVDRLDKTLMRAIK